MAFKRTRREPEEPPLVIVVAGAGEVAYEAVADLLNDRIADDRDVRVYLPVNRTATTDAVVHVADWLLEVGESYTAIVAGKLGATAKDVLKDADDEIETDDLIDSIIDILLTAKKRGEEAYLFLSWGEDLSQAPDTFTGELFDAAQQNGVTVLDLSMGLEDLGYQDEVPDPEEIDADDDGAQAEAPAEPTVTGELSEEEVELEDAPEEDKPASKSITQLLEEKKARRREQQAEGADETIVDGNPQNVPDEAQNTLPEPDGEYPDLVTTLAFVAKHLDHLDRSNAAIQMQPHHHRPLTRAVRHHLQQLLAGEIRDQLDGVEDLAKEAFGSTDDKPAEEPEAPAKTRGKPRNTASDTVAVFHDPSKPSIRLVEGRGRPRKGESREEMSRAAYEDLRASYEGSAT